MFLCMNSIEKRNLSFYGWGIQTVLNNNASFSVFRRGWKKGAIGGRGSFDLEGACWNN